MRFATPRAALGGALLALLALAAPAGAQVFTTTLTGGAERPTPNGSPATGQATATLSGTTLTLTGQFAGLGSNYAASHIHQGPATGTGPVIFSLTPTLAGDNRSGTYAAAANTFTLTADQVTALQAGNLYVNVHTASFPGGEIRGQLLAGNTTPQPLPFSQNWSDTTLVRTNDDWSRVPGIVGYLGDYIPTGPNPVNPDTVLAQPNLNVDVIANQTDPNTLASGGVAEFQTLPNPTVAFQGSGTADAPSLVIRVASSGFVSVRVRANLRDIDGAVDNAVQPVTVQYRVGTSGNFTNVLTTIDDATTGPSEATLVTPVDVTLPAAADNQPSVDIRFITGNATGSDEWVGVDDILITGNPAVAAEGGTTASGLTLRVANPATGRVSVRFALPSAGAARLAVYDVLGREVAVLADGARAAGAHTAALDAGRLAPGAYVVRLQAAGETLAQTVTVVR